MAGTNRPRRRDDEYGVFIDSRWQVFTGPLDGSSKEVLLNLDHNGCGLTWVPDGKRLIVTTCNYEHVNEQTVLKTEAWLISADGSVKTKHETGHSKQACGP